MKVFFTLLILSVLSCTYSYGQDKKSKEVTIVIYYSFTNAKSIEQVDKLKEDIEKLKSVVKVKTEYKVEKQAGQVVVTVIEKVYSGEGNDEKYFDVRDLKRLIIKNDLMPNQIKMETIKK